MTSQKIIYVKKENLAKWVADTYEKLMEEGWYIEEQLELANRPNQYMVILSRESSIDSDLFEEME